MRRAVLIAILLHSTAWAQVEQPTSVAITPAVPILHQCQMYYPPKAMINHEEGVTGVSFRIDQEGHVKDVIVSKSSGHDVLDKAAIACVSGWTYKPATQSGHPVEVTRTANFDWILPKSPMPIGDHDCRSEARKLSSDRSISIQFIVGTDGHVKNVQLSRSSGDTAIDQALIGCVETWQYQPGTKLGQPSEFTEMMPLIAVQTSTRN